MKFLTKLFAKSPAPAPEPITHEGFTITPKPMPEGSQFRLSALIEKDGKTHHLIRADTLGSADAANAAALAKAKQLIDQMGERLF